MGFDATVSIFLSGAGTVTAAKWLRWSFRNNNWLFSYCWLSKTTVLIARITVIQARWWLLIMPLFIVVETRWTLNHVRPPTLQAHTVCLACRWHRFCLKRVLICNKTRKSLYNYRIGWWVSILPQGFVRLGQSVWTSLWSFREGGWGLGPHYVTGTAVRYYFAIFSVLPQPPTICISANHCENLRLCGALLWGISEL